MFVRSLTLLGVAATWLVVTAATAPTPEVHAELDPKPAATACWAEKVTSVKTAEVICGNPALRPKRGTLDVGAAVTVNGKPWVVTITGLEPVSAN